MEQYTPSPEARKQARRIAAVSIITDETPVETITKMCIACIETDFKTPDHPTANHAMSKEMHEAVMTFNVAFMRSICTAMEAHMNGEWTTTPRDD
jgi:hypothetical protein